MRILYHHRTLGDGAEGIHITEMVKAFRSLGHDVHVQGTVGHKNSASHGFAERAKTMLPRTAFELASLGANAAEYRDIRKSIKTIRPDFLYKRHARLDIGAVRAARSAGVPVVLEVNCLFTSTHYERFEPMTLRRLATRLERQALERSDIVLAVSTPLARQIAQMSSVAAVVIPNGVDPIQFDPARVASANVRTRYGLGTQLTIGWSGVIREWHGLELLLDAAAALPDIQLLIVGDGPGRAALEQRAIARGMTERIVITGRVSHEEMPEHVAAMDIAVVASDGTGVASPMKLVEYMAMGRAVVAPRLDNITDIVSNETDALLFESGDPGSLVAALERLVADPALRSQLGRTARTNVERSRNWRHNAAQVILLLASLGRREHKS